MGNRELGPVSPQKGYEVRSGEVSRDELPRRGDASEEPDQIELVSPVRDSDLISAEEGNGRSDAVNRRPVAEVALEIEAQPFLCASADGDYDLLRPQCVQFVDQGPIVDCAAIHRGVVDALRRYVDTLRPQPGQIFRRACGSSHNPEGIA